MAVIGLRELSREPKKVVEKLQSGEGPVIITKQGKPIAALVELTEENIAEYALAALPEFVERRERAREEIATGGGRPSSDVLAEVEAEDKGYDDDE